MVSAWMEKSQEEYFEPRATQNLVFRDLKEKKNQTTVSIIQPLRNHGKAWKIDKFISALKSAYSHRSKTNS